MRKRPLAAALAAALCLGLFGCATAGERPQPSPSDAAPAQTAAPMTAAPSADAALLLSFLNGETAAAVGEDFYNDLAYLCDGAWDGVERLTFSSLAEMVAGSVEGEERDGAVAVSYALMETLGGREMLAARYQCDAGGENFWAYFIFGVFDREVRLTYAEDCWSRSYTELCQGLIFSGGGSGGAGDHLSWYGYVDDAGRYRSVYRAETLTGQWVAMYAAEVFDQDIDWAEGCECCLLTTDEGRFYALDAGADTDEEKLARFRQYLAERGIAEISNAQEAIAQAKDAHGLADTEPFDGWTPWAPQG